MSKLNELLKQAGVLLPNNSLEGNSEYARILQEAPFTTDLKTVLVFKGLSEEEACKTRQALRYAARKLADAWYIETKALLEADTYTIYVGKYQKLSKVSKEES